jgi:ribonuclease Z
MKRVVIVLGIVVAVLLGAFALIWFVPAVQDRIVQSAMTRQIAKNARTPYLGDDALHILLCGTGSPMPDMTRANACAAVIAGGRVVVIDAGPGAWSRLAAANIPGAKIDTVLLTHLHSDHIGDLGQVATQSWLGGRKVPLDVYGPPAPEPSERTTDAEGEAFGVAGTEDVVKGFAEAYNSDAEFRIAQGHELVPAEGARMIGHDVARPGPEEAVTVYDKDGLKISAFLANHDTAIASNRRAGRGGERRHGAGREHGALLERCRCAGA